jgi:hypothetical protein
MTKRDDDIADLARSPGDDWARRMASEREKETASMAALRASLLAAARAAGAMTIAARYEGGHDSGAIQSIEAEPARAQSALETVTTEVLVQRYDGAVQANVAQMTPVGFFEAAEDFLAWVATEQHGNWWDGDIETSGEVVWHVADDPDRITGEHEFVRRESEWTEWEEDRDGDLIPPVAEGA